MKKDMTFSADFARCGYTKVSRQAMQIAFTPGDKCEKEAKVLLCILGFAYFKKEKSPFISKTMLVNEASGSPLIRNWHGVRG